MTVQIKTTGGTLGGRTQIAGAAGMFLLIDAELPRSLALAAQLHARGFVAHARGPIAQTAVASLEEELDVALLQLGGTDWDAIAHAQRLFARDASIEVIFFAESECAQLAMARGLGIQGILPAEAVAEWTLAAAPSLVGSVRARRALTESTRGIPPLPPFPARPRWAGPTMPLTVAEQRFREAFLRQLLAEAPNRDAAARIAGIPYRTLCAMLQKLGLTSTAADRRAAERSDFRPGAGNRSANDADN